MRIDAVNVLGGTIALILLLTTAYIIKEAKEPHSVDYIEPSKVTRSNITKYLVENGKALEEDNYPIADIFYCVAGSLNDGSFPELYTMIKKFSADRVNVLEKNASSDATIISKEHEMFSVVIEELEKMNTESPTDTTNSPLSDTQTHQFYKVDVEKMPKL